MKRNFKDIYYSHFPDIDQKKFQEWKQAGISYWKKVRLYYIIIGLVLAGSILTINAIFQFPLGGIPIAILFGGSFLIARFIALELPGRDYKKLSKELGITPETIKKALSGKIIRRNDLIIEGNSNLSLTEKEVAFTEAENYSDKELVTEITKINKKQILGESSILDEEISLIAKLTYSKGLKYFDDLINEAGRKENYVIQLYKRKLALEIRSATLFNHYSVGINYEYINHVSISNKTINNLTIHLRNREAITFNYKLGDSFEIKTFFKDKLKLKLIE